MSAISCQSDGACLCDPPRTGGCCVEQPATCAFSCNQMTANSVSASTICCASTSHSVGVGWGVEGGTTTAGDGSRVSDFHGSIRVNRRTRPSDTREMISVKIATHYTIDPLNSISRGQPKHIPGYRPNQVRSPKFRGVLGGGRIARSDQPIIRPTTAMITCRQPRSR